MFYCYSSLRHPSVYEQQELIEYNLSLSNVGLLLHALCVPNDRIRPNFRFQHFFPFLLGFAHPHAPNSRTYFSFWGSIVFIFVVPPMCN